MLQHTAEGYDLSPTLIETVANDLIIGVEGRGDILQRAFLVGFLHLELEDIESVINLEIGAHMLHVERIEVGLGLTESYLHLTHL